MGNANIELSGKLTEEEAYGHLSGKIMDGISTGKVKTRKIKCSCPPLVIVKLAEYPALRAGMNAKCQLHENFPNEPSYPAHCAGSLASAREALRKI
ncbi:hypothetical protein COT30_00785 [Candidatus Micrarchaeota archaeon CG08_land_8_20_14_0_20_49_17]|nr:MAG: hypothetical protein COT30_00785 [Candidatus Micrarchaeota archaeon CG08_land_8_20_14_0_20_49_17]PIZ95523.1 MAG: hypothetical protein COX84_04440 [Candidatus Micrarchaeota archaeon CG_4_10_14_0_2_um_filter_49_7]